MTGNASAVALQEAGGELRPRSAPAQRTSMEWQVQSPSLLLEVSNQYWCTRDQHRESHNGARGVNNQRVARARTMNSTLVKLSCGLKSRAVTVDGKISAEFAVAGTHAARMRHSVASSTASGDGSCCG